MIEFHKGDRVHVKHGGRKGNGTISQEPNPEDNYVTYRADKYGSEHVALKENVKITNLKPYTPKEKKKELKVKLAGKF